MSRSNKPKWNYKRKKGSIIYLIGVVLVLTLLALLLLPLYVSTLFLNQRFDQVQHDSADYGIESQRITLTTSDGIDVAAWRTFASDGEEDSQNPKGTVIILSGIQNPSVTAFFGYANMLSEHGWDTLLVEMRARGNSGGNSIGLGYTEWRDVEAGVEYLREDADRASELPIVVMGSSAGGATALLAAANIPEIDGVISISGYTTFIDAYVDNAAHTGVPRFFANWSRPFMNIILGVQIGFEEMERTPIDSLENFAGRPLLLMHSTEDWQVPFTHFEELKEAAEDAPVDLSTFVREGDWHFVVYDQYKENPENDSEFTQEILSFLDQF